MSGVRSPRPTVAVVGAGDPPHALEQVALAVGIGLAQAGADLVCGGLGGVMAAACRGHAGVPGRRGLTVGLLPGADRRGANAWLDVAVPTGLGEARNALVARTGDVVIAIGGGFGTLSEIALAVKAGTPVVGVHTWRLAPPDGSTAGILHCDDADAAVCAALEAAGGRVQKVDEVGSGT